MAKKLTPEEEAEKVAEILEEAREKMNDSGRHWIKGAYRKYFKKDDLGSCYCSMGAIYSVTRSKEYRDLAVLALCRYGLRKKGDSWLVVSWNDAPRRKWEDVDKAFKTAAEKVREKGLPA